MGQISFQLVGSKFDTRCFLRAKISLVGPFRLWPLMTKRFKVKSRAVSCYSDAP